MVTTLEGPKVKATTAREAAKESGAKTTAHHTLPEQEFHIDAYQLGENIDLLAKFVGKNMWITEFMPDLGGFTGPIVAGSARSLQTTARLGANMPVMAARSYAAGMVWAVVSFVPVLDVITKPFSEKPLGQILGDAIAGEVDWQQARKDALDKNPDQYRLANSKWGQKLEGKASVVNDGFNKLLGHSEEIAAIAKEIKAGNKDAATKKAFALLNQVRKEQKEEQPNNNKKPEGTASRSPKPEVNSSKAKSEVSSAEPENEKGFFGKAYTVLAATPFIGGFFSAAESAAKGAKTTANHIANGDINKVDNELLATGAEVGVHLADGVTGSAITAVDGIELAGHIKNEGNLKDALRQQQGVAKKLGREIREQGAEQPAATKARSGGFAEVKQSQLRLSGGASGKARGVQIESTITKPSDPALAGKSGFAARLNAQKQLADALAKQEGGIGHN